jgi:hypothetical protein
MGFFIKTVAPEDATGDLRGYYDEDIAASGMVSNTTRSFSLFPDVFAGWRGLIVPIRKRMRLRNYELTTLAAAMEMGCTF